MKREPLKTGTVAWILAIIYIVGLFLSVWTVCYLLSGSKRRNLTAMTYDFARQYIETKSVSAGHMSGRATLVFGTDKQLQAFFEEKGYPIHFDFVKEGEKYVDRVLDGQEIHRIVLFAPNDTTLRYTSLCYIGVPLMEDGQITGALFWVQELRDLLEAILAFVCTFTAVFVVVAVFVLLNLYRQRRYEQMRRHYIDNITHELKGPVASIKALAEALSDGMDKSPADRNVYYGMILKEANRQERMICDVLELSKLQSYQTRAEKQVLSAWETMEPVCEKYASLCDLMEIGFSVSEEIYGLGELYTDEKYILAVTEVLLSNALKFVHEGGEIRLSAQQSRRRVTFCVEDNGRGIAKEELPYVFERFYKGKRNDNETGSGLGLAIAREITDNMREKLWITSREGQGTRAYFTVSLKRAIRSK